MKTLNKEIKNFPESIFSTISNLSLQYNALNLGQGFPNFETAPWLKEMAADTFKNSNYQQYASSIGVESLRIEIKNYYKSFYNIDINHQNNVTITQGATEGILIASLAVANPGDEVIVMEPFYDGYTATIKMANANPVGYKLKAPDFKLDLTELERLITKKTKAIFFNNPHNPLGKVFSEHEIKGLIALCKKHNVYLISDEVYEFLTYDDNTHHPVFRYEDAKDIAIILSSAGKTFGMTGWKVGWMIANEEVTKQLRNVKQYTTFCSVHPLQHAVARGLQKIDEYIPYFQNCFQKKKELFLKEAESSKLDFYSIEGTYFCTAKLPNGFKDDLTFCEYLIKNHGLATIPTSSFYLNPSDSDNLIRFCFAKDDDTIIKAGSILRSLP